MHQSVFSTVKPDDGIDQQQQAGGGVERLAHNQNCSAAGQQQQQAGCSSSMGDDEVVVMGEEENSVQQQQPQHDNNDDLDKALELFACSYNLTAQNVKNIIYHIVKNPQTFATLVRKDPDAMAGLRMTRARLRQLERIARRRIPTARLRPIVGPKTFLDINYGDDDDDDDEEDGGGGGARAEGTSAPSRRTEEEEDADYSPANDPTATKRRHRQQRRSKTGGEAHPNSDESTPEDEEDLSSSPCSSDTDFVCSDMDEDGTEHCQNPVVVDDDNAACPLGGDEHQQQKKQQQRNVEVEEEEEDGEQSVEFLTKVDNPIYPIFIKSLATEAEIDPEVRQQLYEDEDNDPEYVFPAFDGLCDEQEDEYEFRRDRATEIPRWEVKALEQDFEDGEDDPSPLDVPVEPICADGTLTMANGRRHSANSGVELTDDRESRIFWRSNFAKPYSTEQLCSSSSLLFGTEHPNKEPSTNNGDGMPKAPRTTTTSAPEEDEEKAKSDDNRQDNNISNRNTPPNPSSCSLLDPAPTIGQVELEALEVQLVKHVQLLCQAIVGTIQYPRLVEPHNKAMLMLRELDALARERGDQSVFNVPTLEAAIYSAHDAKACREVNLAPAPPADQYADVYQKQLMKHNSEQQPSNETMWVLSRSGAVRYPDLLCPYRFFDDHWYGSNRNSSTNSPQQTMTKIGVMAPQLQRFLHSEQLLLAIGLYQLNGVPPRHGKLPTRYQLIQQHFLPTKRIDQIRNHIRNVHACPSPTIYHQLIMEAEKGRFPVTYRPDLGETAQQRVPIEWPSRVQPYWLKWLSSLLSKSQTQMIMVHDEDAVADQQSVEPQHGTDPLADQHYHQRRHHHLSAASHLDSTIMTSNNKDDDNNGDGGVDDAAETTLNWCHHQQQQQRDNKNKTMLRPRILTTARKQRFASTITAAAGELLGDIEIVGEQQQQQNVVDEEQQQQNQVGIETRLRKRIRIASSTAEDGGGHVEDSGCGTAGSGGRATTTAAPAVAASMTTDTSCCSSSGVNGATESSAATTSAESSTSNNNNPTNNCSEHCSTQQRKSRRHERAERGMAALCDARACAQTDRALAIAIYEDFKKRMFMHQDKLRAVQRVLSSADAARHGGQARCFASLWQLMGLTHPQLFHLFAAIAPEAQLPPAVRVDPHWQACKRALRMLKTIHTYLAASRTPAQMKHMLKFLKEAALEITSEQQFFETLQRQFAVREEPLWRLLRREWMGAKFVEIVEDWEYEFVDMDKQQQQQCSSETNAAPPAVGDDDQNAFEQVRLPYRRDPSERSRLRLRHGRVTAELNGRLCNVAIACAPPSESSSSRSGPLSAAPSTSCCPPATTHHPGDDNGGQQTQKNRACLWTRKMDMELMLAYKGAGGDAKECVHAFLLHRSAQCCKTGAMAMGADDVGQRLGQLLNVANTLKRRRKETE